MGDRPGAIADRLTGGSLFNAYDTPLAHFVTYAFRDPLDSKMWNDEVFRLLHKVRQTMDWKGFPASLPVLVPVFAGTIVDRRLADAKWSAGGRFEVEAATMAFPTATTQQDALDFMVGHATPFSLGIDGHRDPPQSYGLAPIAVLTPSSTIYLGGYGPDFETIGGEICVKAKTEQEWHTLTSLDSRSALAIIRKLLAETPASRVEQS